MQRNFLRGFLICLIPCLVAGVYAAKPDRYKLGIDLAGGTILVYEINVERTKQLNAARRDRDGDRQAVSADQGLSSDDMLKLAAQIKRRIDPTDLKNVTVRPLGSTRIEIILPTGGSSGTKTNLTNEDIEEVKQLVSKMGVLEFRILANTTDDEVGVRVAREKIDNAVESDLNRWAAANSPPEAPLEDFEVKAASDRSQKVRYAWVEVGAVERESLGLSNKSIGMGLWAELEKTRNKTYVYETRARSKENEPAKIDMVFYSRPVAPNSPRGQEDLAEEAKGAEGNPKKIEYYLLTRVSSVDSVRVEGDISLTAQQSTDGSGNLAISFTFNGAGAQAFGRMTERNRPSGEATKTKRSLAILLDDQIISAPSLDAVISAQGQITGKFDKIYVERLVNFLRNGALNAQLREKPVSENTIGPTLGEDTVRKGTEAVGISFAAILIFMLVYYRFAGVVACIALLANLLMTVGFMVGVNAAFTLPGLAGIVLMLGMAVDANVLIYERLREERNKGASLAAAIRNGYDHAFPTIIDTHLSSIFTAIVLYLFGNDQLKGFAISLTVGLVISLFTSLYMTRLLFDWWLSRRLLTKLKMMRLFERPSYNPMKYRYALFSLTSILTVLGLALFLTRGEAGLNVDFRGGTVYSGKLKDGHELSLSAIGNEPGLRDLLGEQNQRDRLKVLSARWVNRPSSGDIDAVGVYVYEITYAPNNLTTTVSLTQRPAGADEKAMEADVVARASQLPDVSVEQLFLSGETYSNNRSRYFTVRTTERQPELVRASLDRLLRDDQGVALVSSPLVKVGKIDGPTVELSFDRPMSPSMLREMFEREFKKESADDAQTTFTLVPSGESTNGRYLTIKLDVSKNGKFSALRRKADSEGELLSAFNTKSVRSAFAGLAAVVGSDLVNAIAPPNPEELKGQLATLTEIVNKTKQAVETNPEPERLEVFDSTLAAETRTKAFFAILASWGTILLYLWFRFGNWTFGAAAVLCLIHDLCFTLGAIALCHYLHDNPFGSFLRLEDFKIDLPTVAALLTLVGYSVNDTIVVFDRIREVRGKSPALTPQMINDSVNQTLSRTVLASLTVFLVVSVLYIFGGEGVHLFAFVMVVGVVVGTYSSVFVASPLLLLFGEGHHELSEAIETSKVEEEAVVEG